MNKQCWIWRPAAGGALILALALWHGLDVKSGAAQSGSWWLFGWYGAVVVWALLAAALCGWILLGRKIPLERLFVPCVLLAGVLYMTVMAPLSAPDEVSHYISAYKLSNTILGKKAVDEKGRVYIRAQDAFAEDLEGILADDGSTQETDRPAVILGQTLGQDTYRMIHEMGILGGERPQGEAVSYQPVVQTTPLAYVPQALGIALARILGLNTLGLMEMGRLFNLIFYAGMGYLTLRRLPFGKEVYFGTALLPMSLHLASSMSYDVMILSLTGYFTAVCLDLAFAKERAGWPDILRLAATLAVMGPCKIVYSVIAGFCLLIPVKKFGSRLRWVLSAVLVLGLLAAALVLINFKTVALYTGVENRYVIWAQEPGFTFSQLIHDPLLVIQMCFNTLAWQGEPLFSGLIGGSLGNMDAVLNTPYPIVLAFAALLAVLALKKPGEEIRLSMGQRVWIWILCLACLGGLMFSMLLAWTPVSSNVIKGVQGRYLLPLLPVFLLTLKNTRVVRTGRGDREILFWMLCMSLYTAVRLFAVVCLRV